MNAGTLKMSLEYDMERATLLLQRLAATGQTQFLGSYHPVTDAMKRISQQIEFLEAGRIDRDAFKEAMLFVWGVLYEFEWQLAEYQDRNNPRWHEAKALAERMDMGAELRRREPVRRSR